MDFGIHESFTSHIVRKVEDVLIRSGRFNLLSRLPHGNFEDINWSTFIVDATETPIERLKKPKATTKVARKNNMP